MRAIEVDRQPSSVTRQAIARFVAEAPDDSGERPVSDHTWLALTAAPLPPMVAVIARELGATTGDAGHLLGAGRIIAAALITETNAGQMLEVVVAEEDAGSAVLIDVAETALDLGADTNRRLTWWIDDPAAEVVAAAAAHGLAPGRQLYAMRRTLPAEWRSAVATRAFRPGADDEAWLEVNNRAFATHPEQGGWTPAALASRVSEPWFDPAGLRLYDVDHRVRGFCWTKIHRREPESVGEIYVIGVDPLLQGGGLGRQLTLAGMDWLADQGMTAVMLFVDAANAAAVRTYRQLGFDVVRTRTALTTESQLAN